MNVAKSGGGSATWYMHEVAQRRPMSLGGHNVGGFVREGFNCKRGVCCMSNQHRTALIGVVLCSCVVCHGWLIDGYAQVVQPKAEQHQQEAHARDDLILNRQRF